MKNRNLFLTAMLAATLAGMLTTGCASLNVMKETVVEETITLESPDAPKALGIEWGYTEEVTTFTGLPIPGFIGPFPDYPQAKVIKYTATDKKTGVNRECVVIASIHSIPKWQTARRLNEKPIVLLGVVYDTEAEANAAAEAKKKEVDAGTAQTIVVERIVESTRYKYDGMKPLQ
jgi:hypothetical protein